MLRESADLRTGFCKYQFNFFEVGTITVSGTSQFLSAVIDVPNQFAYFGTGNSPGKVTKINLSNFTIASTLTLNSGENNLISAVIESGFAYFGTNTIPAGVITKIDLTTFTEVSGHIVLNSGESGLACAVIDTVNRLAYFGTITSLNNTSKVVKIDLSTFTRVTSITTNSGESVFNSAVIDSGFAYFATLQNRVVKINLSTFTEVSGNVLIAGSVGTPVPCVIDTANRFAYFGNFTTLNKINLNTFTSVGTTGVSNTSVESAVIDPINGFAYFGNAATNTNNITKVNLKTFTRVGAISASGQAIITPAAVIDPINGFAYFGTVDIPGHVVKVAVI